MLFFARQKSLFALKPFHVDAVFADLRPEGTRVEAEEFGSAVLSGDFAVGAVERLDDIIDGDLVKCLEWFRIVLVPLAVRLLLALRGREVKSAVGRIFGKDVQEIIDKDRLDAGTDLEMFLRIIVHTHRYHNHSNARFPQHVKLQGNVHGRCVRLVDRAVHVGVRTGFVPGKDF